ncbi:hypothetical protein RJ639_037738 [Escallonia herrerae]|uniref:Rapid ALkalinization Factor n=1 Tax=Escallonia herrerae TaxID=1293975 RepID=A0AA88WQV6_9ASTE|nr:hypothetical protein RJ639_037738 [Escallonia herrerae]
MAIPSLKAASLLLSLLLLYTFSINPLVQAQPDGTGFQLVTTDALQWQSAAASVYGDPDLDEEEQGIDGGVERRSLYWSQKRYYISYGALSANRIPCPARSGRSYYNHNCYVHNDPANPYTRGCSTITRCRR